MRILNVFIDMVGADYLHLANESNNKSALDIFLEELGGTIYTQCYTPAPDTPRSTACMWSGLYPRRNGCNNRLKYPKRFLNDTEQGNLWKSLRDAGYELNAFIRQTANEIGMLPDGFQNVSKPCSTIESYIEEWKPSEDSYSFFYLCDLHSFLDSNGYTPKKVQKGLELVVRMLRKIFTNYAADDFDYIMFYSDHGFRYEGIKRNHLLEDDRVKTLMFVRKKGDKKLATDSRLRSNLDVFPTTLDMIGVCVPTGLDGKSLFSDGHEYLLLEDHDDFTVRLSQSIEHWAVFTLNNKYWLECSGKWDSLVDDKAEFSYYEKLIREKMDNYDENRKLWNALHIYDDSKVIDNTYSDGSKIVSPFYRSKRIMAIRIIFRKIFRLFV